MAYFLMTIKKIITITAEDDEDAQRQAIDQYDSMELTDDGWDLDLDKLEFPEQPRVIH